VPQIVVLGLESLLMSQGKGVSSSYSSRSLFMDAQISCSTGGEQPVGAKESSGLV